MKLLITGGAGFVGSSLALAFKETGSWDVTALDNLKRRGSEFNLPRLKKAGIEFVHGDIRNPNDLNALRGGFDLMIEASAEPSVLAGANGDPSYVLETNLFGTVHCLEFARKNVAKTIFLSTSRVYSLAPLQSLKLIETPTRLALDPDQTTVGSSAHGISESFPTHLARSLYGATKLSSEFLVQEYAQSYGLNAVINRCGVIAGPGQFGKVDQGVFTLWVAHHFLGKPLQYLGFGGTGKQVRDLLHPQDLFELLQKQILNSEIWNAEVFNVGGGTQFSVSLQELTSLAREITGREVSISSRIETHGADIPYYVSDCRKVEKVLSWAPKKSPGDIVREIAVWLKANPEMVQEIFK